jgi:RNA polymerase sigma-70 factor (ECF subfamily)
MTGETHAQQWAEVDEAVGRVLAGDREAYRVVIEACESRLRMLVAGVLPEAAAVEDVVQQAFLVAYGKLASYRLGTGFLAWIATIARYEALNERRRWLSERSLRKRYGDELRIEQAVGPALEEATAPDALLVARLHDCIGGLRERAGAVLRAHYFEHQGNEAIAERHGRDLGWVRLVLHRARQALADCLRAKGAVEHA